MIDGHEFTYGKFCVLTDWFTGDRVVIFENGVVAKLSGDDFLELIGALAYSADSWEIRHKIPPPSMFPTHSLIPSTDLRRAIVL